jgi:hypothetical protein
MTFLLSDQNFINEVLKISLAQETNLKPVFELAKKMLNSLKLTEIQNVGGDNPEQKDLVKLNNYLLYLNRNSFKYNNLDLIVVGKDKLSTLDSQIQKLYFPYKDNVTFIYKDGLIATLKDLRVKANNSGNLYFVELVNKLIDEANTDLKTNIGAQELQSSQQQSKTNQSQSDKKPTNTTQLDLNNPQNRTYIIYNTTKPELSKINSAWPFVENQINLALMRRFSGFVDDFTDKAYKTEPVNQMLEDYIPVMRSDTNKLRTQIAEYNNFVSQFNIDIKDKIGFTYTQPNWKSYFEKYFGNSLNAKEGARYLYKIVDTTLDLLQSLYNIEALRSLLGGKLQQQMNLGETYKKYLNSIL